MEMHLSLPEVEPIFEPEISVLTERSLGMMEARYLPSRRVIFLLSMQLME